MVYGLWGATPSGTSSSKHRLSQTTDHKLQTTNYRPQTTDHKLQTTNYRPQTTDHRPQTTDLGPGTRDRNVERCCNGLNCYSVRGCQSNQATASMRA
jgi:hypothetical protein